MVASTSNTSQLSQKAAISIFTSPLPTPLFDLRSLRCFDTPTTNTFNVDIRGSRCAESLAKRKCRNLAARWDATAISLRSVDATCHTDNSFLPVSSQRTVQISSPVIPSTPTTTIPHHHHSSFLRSVFSSFFFPPFPYHTYARAHTHTQNSAHIHAYFAPDRRTRCVCVKGRDRVRPHRVTHPVRKGRRKTRQDNSSLCRP